MKVSFFETGRDQMPVPLPAERPAAPANDSPQAGDKEYQAMIERLEYVASIGFDWASPSEHHYSPRILTPSPIVSAAYVAAKVKNLKIALLGPIVPQANPIRIAEELAMVDTMSQGPLVVGLLRGATNEYLSFDLNPAEGRERTDDGMELILKAWTSHNPSAGRDATTSTVPSPSGRARCSNRTPRPTRSAPARSRATSRPGLRRPRR